jgi:AcrR family transcriptional regulator
MAAGRPRAFDKEKALEAAMHVFWRNGYAGTSMADLTGAMAINKPSLYAAFGNKEQLFVAAVEQYTRLISPSLDYLYAPDQPLDERIYAHLKSVSQRLCHPDLPQGCLLANSTCEAGGEGVSPAGRSLVAHINDETQQHLTEFFAQEQANGTISHQRSPEALALYLMSINSGMAVLARNGATQSQLDEMIEHVVTTFT